MSPDLGQMPKRRERPSGAVSVSLSPGEAFLVFHSGMAFGSSRLTSSARVAKGGISSSCQAMAPDPMRLSGDFL